jgi:hypothetical protein
VLLSIRLQFVRDLRHERVVRVGVREQRADGQEHLRDGERGRPLLLEDVQTDAAARVHVAVVDFRGECDFRGLEGVVCGELDIEEEYTALVGALAGTHDCCLPVELIIVYGTCVVLKWREVVRRCQTFNIKERERRDERRRRD